MRGLLIAGAVIFLALPARGQAVPPVPFDKSDDDRVETPCTYPPKALDSHIEGATMVSYTGTAQGRFVEVTVIRSSGNAELDDAAVQCVSNWHFNPDDAAATLYRGQQRAYIGWSIPDASAGGPSKASGVRMGIPHVCMQDYPKAEVLAGIGGTTTVSFTITERGLVRDVAVAESSGNANLDAAALRCVPYWRYRPIIVDGKPASQPWMAKVVWRVTPLTITPPPFAEPPRDCVHFYPIRPGELQADGATEVRYTISGEGVRKAEIVRSSGSKTLDRAAVECISSRKYQGIPIYDDNGKQIGWRTFTLREQIKWGSAVKTEP